MKMLPMILSTVALCGLTTAVFAADQSATNATQKQTDRKSRKKKVEICAECGKPETECDCPGYEHKGSHDEHKKKEEKKK